MSTLIRVHGLHQPTLNRDIVNEQIQLSHLLYNEYIYVERRRRKAYRKAQFAFQDIRDEHKLVTDIEFEAREVFKSYKKTRHLPSGASGKTPKVAVQKIYTILTKARKKLTDAIRSHIEELQPAYDEIDKKWGIYGSERKAKKAVSGVFWGTELRISSAANQACNAKVEYFDINGNPRNIVQWEHAPAFRDPDKDFEGGLVCVQLQNGIMPVSKVFNKDNIERGYLHIAPLPANAFDESLPRSERAKLQRTTVHLRVGSTGSGNRQPIWASWPLFLHRALPEAKPGETPPIITWATIVRKPWKQEFRYRWELQLTIETPVVLPKQFRNAVAINLGWRQVEGGDLRVATWVDSDGNSGYQLLDDKRFRSRIRAVEQKRGYRDTCLSKLQGYLISHGVPYSQWRNLKRYEELQHQGTLAPDVQAHLDAWMEEDHHHWRYESGSRRGALRYRKEIYRLFALEMAEKYDVIVIEKYNIKNIAEDEDRLKEPSAQRVEGSPSEARQIIRSTAPQHGCLILEGDSKKATQHCNVCGCEDPWDAAPQIEHHCTGCDTVWDQDINNAKNMLDRAKPILESPEALAKAYAKQVAKKAARYAKKHKKHEEDDTDEEQ